MPTTTNFQDRYGLSLTAGTAAAVDAYVDGLDRLFSQNLGAESSLQRAIQADEGFALGHIAFAVAQQALGNTVEAKQAAACANNLLGGVSRRERQHVEAISAVLDANTPLALTLMEEHLAEFPRDALVVHQANTLFQFAGLEHRQQRRMAFLSKLAPALGEDWYFLSLYSFAHHELDLLDESERLSRRSLDQYPRNANAAHNIAHVFYERSDHTAGIAFLAGWLAPYEHNAPFHCHLSWHLALSALASADYAGAMRVYESSISPKVAKARNTLYDASALLWRYQTYGCAEDRLPWQEVGELADRMTARPGMAFADAHAALVYAAMGNDPAIARLISGLEERAREGHPIAGAVTIPLVRAVVAFANGDYAETIRQIAPLGDQVVRIGGSNAQREVFEETLIEAYLRLEQFDHAETLLRRRLSRRSSARDGYWLGRALVGTGETAKAKESIDQALESWNSADPNAAEQRALTTLEASLP